MTAVRVLVVDDSATMRTLISAALRREPQIEVVGQAADPIEARQAIKTLNPDVVTLDIEMPNMNGLEFLEKIMRLKPTPVIMVSNLTGRGAAETIRALEIGAFDCVSKPTGQDLRPFDGLVDKVLAAARAKMHASSAAVARTQSRTPAAPPRPRANYTPDGRVVALGSSTGGVEALIAVLENFPANCPPTVITQHMPGTFTKSFAARLDRLCAASVTEAVDGAVLGVGRIYLAPGGSAHLEVVGSGSGTWRCRLRETDLVSGHRPSVDVLFHSVAKAAGSRALGIILTGMGRDGAEGLLAMRQAGARTLGQDEASCIVYGMPKSAFDIGAVEKQLPLTKIGHEILALTSFGKEGAQ